MGIIWVFFGCGQLLEQNTLMGLFEIYTGITLLAFSLILIDEINKS